MKYLKYKLPTFVLLLILPFVLTACSLQDLPVIGKFFGPRITEPVTLTVWGLWEDADLMNNMISKYQEKNPNVTIQYEDRSVMELITYKERVYERAKDGSAPDIMRVHNSWVKRLSAYLTPMPKRLMETSAYKDLFYPVSTDSAVIDGNIMAVPLFYDGLVLLYNKEHFSALGQQTPPIAWEEFRRLALDLSVRGEKGELVRAGAALGNAKNIDHFSDIIGLMWAQAGIKYPDDVDSKAAQDAFVFYTNFVKEDKVWSDDFPEATTAFVEGKVSMIFVPSWQILNILEAAPQLDIGIAQVPQALPDNPATWGSFWMEVVAANSSRADVAWDFINFLAAEEQQLYYFSEVSKTRAFGAPYSLVSLAGEIKDNPYIGPVINGATTAKSAEIAGRAGNRRQIVALEEAVDSVLSNGDVGEALSAAKEVFVL